MKKCFLFACVFCCFAFWGCASNNYAPIHRVADFGKIDFKKYSDSDFYFSPYLYNGKYKPIGMFSLSLIPAARYVDSCPAKNPDCKTWEVVGWLVEPVDIQQALDSMYAVSKKLGANALVDIKLKKDIIRPRTDLDISVYEVSGFAINRADK